MPLREKLGREFRLKARDGNITLAVIRDYLGKGKNINEAGAGTKMTALHWSLKYGHAEQAVLLHNHGADLVLPDSQEKIPLDYTNDIDLKHRLVHAEISRFYEQQGFFKEIYISDPQGALELLHTWSSNFCERHGGLTDGNDTFIGESMKKFLEDNVPPGYNIAMEIETFAKTLVM